MTTTLRACALRAFRAYVRLRWARRFGSFGARVILHRPHKNTGLHHVELGDDVELGPLWRLEALPQGGRPAPRISIGAGTASEIGLHVGAVEEVTIGRDVLIASWVYLSDHSHGIQHELPPRHAPIEGVRPIRIGDGCWLGERSIVLPGVELGPRCVVGAGAVVTASFPAGTVLAGVPAKPLRTLSLDD